MSNLFKRTLLASACVVQAFGLSALAADHSSDAPVTSIYRIGYPVEVSIIGKELGNTLLDMGGDKIMEEIHSS